MKISKPFIELFDRLIDNEVKNSLEKYKLITDNIQIFEQYFGFKMSLDKDVDLKLEAVFKKVPNQHLVLLRKECVLCRLKKLASKQPYRHNQNSYYGSFSVNVFEGSKGIPLTIKEGRLNIAHDKFFSGQDIHDSQKRIGKFTFFDILLSCVIELLAFEDAFPGQKFLKYFNVAKFYSDFKVTPSIEVGLSMTNYVSDMGRVLHVYGFPTSERLRYLLWKEYLQEFCSHHDIESRAPHVHELLNADGIKNDDNFPSRIKTHIWEATWNCNNFKWFDKIKDANGNIHEVITHIHEVDLEYVKSVHGDYQPKTVHVTPRQFYEVGHQQALEKKRKRMSAREPFIYLDTDLLETDKDQVKPIKDSIELIEEGLKMAHCIGKDDYLDDGISKDKIYFRINLFPDRPFKEGGVFTVTMQWTDNSFGFLDVDCLTKDELEKFVEDFWYPTDKMQEGDNGVYTFPGYEFSEMWGWDNFEPSFDDLVEIHRFIFKNRKAFEKCNQERLNKS